MLTPTNEALAGRIDRLEAENRRLKRGGLALAVGACLLLAGGAAMKRSTTVVTERLVIVDKNGNERARLGTSPEGYTSFSLKDEKDRVGLFILQGVGGSTLLTLSDPSETDRLRLGVDGKGHPFLSMYDEKELERLNLRVEPKFLGLSLLDQNDKQRAAYGLDLGENPTLSFFDKDAPRLGMRLRPDGNPSIELFDKKELRGKFEITEDNNALLYVKGEKGIGHAELLSKENGDAWLRVLDNGGKWLFQGPNP